MPNNQFGDFQTPFDLAMRCLKTLRPDNNARFLEPTCGRGSFLRAAKEQFPGVERRGIELNPEYSSEAAKYGQVDTADIYTYDLERIDWESKGKLFVIGNPPWVTTAELKRMGSSNIPVKSNFKKMQGMEALLGGSNFDICEFIILEMVSAFLGQDMTLGMLCKTQVARNVLEYAARNKLPISNAKIYRIDAKKWFDAAADACWFVFDSNPSIEADYVCGDYPSLESADPIKVLGFCSGKMVSDIGSYKKYADLDGTSPKNWRSGIKHDAAKVFELKEVDGSIMSSFGDVFEPKNSAIYPLLKSSDIANGRDVGCRWIIVPQRQLGDNTDNLEKDNPVIWRYLNEHAETLDKRRSSIYKGKPRFSVFGIGDYTFAPYKVAISGLYKEPKFRLVSPVEGKPVVFDDTCYFISFNDIESASMVWALLSGNECMSFIRALYFSDSKRPITKKLLQRLDYRKALKEVDEVLSRANIEAERQGIYFDKKKAESICRSLCEQSSEKGHE